MEQDTTTTTPAAARYTVGQGPKGGTEYRRWRKHEAGHEVYRVVGKFEAWERLTPPQREWAAQHESENRTRRNSQNAMAATWSHIMRGGVSHGK